MYSDAQRRVRVSMTRGTKTSRYCRFWLAIPCRNPLRSGRATRCAPPLCHATEHDFLSGLRTQKTHCDDSLGAAECDLQTCWLPPLSLGGSGRRVARRSA